MNELPENIENILNFFDFDELDNQRKEEVLKHISQTEYLLYRKIIAEAKTLKNSIPQELFDTRGIKNELDKRLLAGDGSRHGWVKLKRAFTFKVPIYRPALATILLIICFYFIYGGLKPDVQYIYSTKFAHDTIYIEKIPESYSGAEEKIKLSKPVKRTNRKIPDIKATNQSKDISNNMFIAENINNEPIDFEKYMKISNKGRTLKDDSALKKYLVSSR